MEGQTELSFRSSELTISLNQTLRRPDPRNVIGVHHWIRCCLMGGAISKHHTFVIFIADSLLFGLR